MILKQPYKVFALSIILMLIGGLMSPLRFAVNKIAVEGGLSPIAFAFWPIFFSGLLLLIIALLKGHKIQLRPSYIRAYLIIGGLILAGPMAVLTYLADKLPQGIISLTVGFAPVLTYFFAILLKVDQVKAICVTGLIIGLGGILLITIPDMSLPEHGMVGWLLLALLAPVGLGLGNVLTSTMRPPSIPLTVLAAGMMLSAATILFVLMILTGQLYFFYGATLDAVLNVIYATILCSLFYLMFLEIVRLSGPVFFSQMNYLSVAAGFGWGMILFDEKYSSYVWGGASFMAISVVLLSLGAQKKSKPLG